VRGSNLIAIAAMTGGKEKSPKIQDLFEDVQNRFLRYATDQNSFPTLNTVNAEPV
jgi:hypothetical protein